MKKDTRDRTEDLIADYYLRALDPEELALLQRELMDDVEVRRKFAEAGRDEWLLHHVHDVEEGRSSVESARRPSRRRFRMIAAAAAIAVVMGAFLFSHYTGSGKLIAKNSQTEATARVLSAFVLTGDAISVVNDGDVRKLTAESTLRAGDRVVIPSGGRLRFEYLDDQTEIRLSGNSAFEISDPNGAKHIRLLRGRLTADVAKQSKERPMKVFTADSESVVLGTSFELHADGITRLLVNSGKVLFNHGDDGVLVAAEHMAESDEGEPAAKLFRSRLFAPVAEKTTNYDGKKKYIVVDPVRKYQGLLKFDLGKLDGTIFEARLRLRVVRKGSEKGGSGNVRLFRLDDASEGKIQRTEIAGYTGKVGAGMNLEFEVDPAVLVDGDLALLISLDENGNDFWFSSSQGEHAPELEIKMVSNEERVVKGLK